MLQMKEDLPLIAAEPKLVTFLSDGTLPLNFDNCQILGKHKI